MNSFLKLATVAAMATASAFAQTDLKAKIPFAFATPGGAEMPAGTYEIAKANFTSAIPTYRIINVETKKSVLAMVSEPVKRPASDKTGAPLVTFQCAGDNCALSGLFTGTNEYGYSVRTRLKNVDPKVQIAEIAIPFGE